MMSFFIKKTVLASGCIINSCSDVDSTIRFNKNIGQVCSILECKNQKYFLVKKYLTIEDFFFEPICSSEVGVFLVNKLSDSYTVLKYTSDVRKCLLLPYKAKFVAVEMIHAVS